MNYYLSTFLLFCLAGTQANQTSFRSDDEVILTGEVPKLDGKIIGGQRVDIFSFPYQVSVRLYDNHICGGAIISENTILTAAHCVYGMDHSQYSVRVGSSDHNRGTSYTVYQVIQHWQYNPRTYNNDLAILKVSVPINFSSSVQPVELQSENENTPIGTIAWVSGWGVAQEGSHKVQSKLRAVGLTVIANSVCNNRYGGGITSSMMCAQTIGKDSCQGDSGGPLVADGTLIGIVSWGYGCARPRYPGVYSKISKMYEWIIAYSY